MGGAQGIGLRLGATAVAALLAAAALGYGLFRMLPPRDPQVTLSPPSAPSPPAGEPERPAPVKPLPVVEAPKPLSKVPPAVPAAPDLPGPDSPPSVLALEPSEPRAGGSLTIQLGGLRGRGVYQFRTDPNGPWRTAPDGRIVLKDLRPGPLTLEFRILNPAGQASPIKKRTLTVGGPLLVRPREPGPQEGDEFFQEVVISRASRYSVLGADVGQNVQYALVSRFTVTKKEPDGTLKVRQKVEAVRLAEADKALQGRLDDLLQKTKGATFRLTLNPRREVTAFEGPKEPLKIFEGANALGGPTFLLWSFLDQDGWKELAEVSFFRPRQPPRKGDRWARPTAHSWGPLGSWQGQVGFVHLGKQAGLERYDYLLDLQYRPPAAGASALPFQITRADFQVQTARGAIAFDPGRGRVTAAEERFGVRGILGVSALGLEGVVEMDEVQLFQLRRHDRNPLEK
jgi:hypothetical protein